MKYVERKVDVLGHVVGGNDARRGLELVYAVVTMVIIVCCGG